GGGVEAVLVGGELYVRPRYGKFTRRRPEGDEVERLRALAEGTAGDYLELLQRWLAIGPPSPVEVAGKKAVKLALALGTPAPATDEDEPARAWRNTLKVSRLDGEVALEAASHAPLSVKLDTTYSFEREGLKGPLQVALEYRQETGA